MIGSAAFGQSQSLSIANYQLVSQQAVGRNLAVTYRADLVNTGTALQAVIATVTSLETSTIQVAAGQNTLMFAPVPANSEVTSSGTFTLQIYGGSLPVDFSKLQWTFQTTAILLPANVSVAAGDTVSFPVSLGTAAPTGGLFISLKSSNTSIATVSPSTFFIPQGLTTNPRTVATVTGNQAGSVTITASASGYATASQQLQVTSGGPTAITMSFWPGSLTIDETATQNLTLNLSAPAPAGLTVNLTSNEPGVATVPPTISFATGSTSESIPVSGLAAGSATITASAANITSATASVAVTQPTTGAAGVVLPANVTVAAGAGVTLSVALGTPAPTGGVTITLASSNTATATIFPTTIFVSAGATTSRRVVTTLTGINAGSVAITGSAPGYAAATAQVQVTGVTPISPTMSFSPGSLTINGVATQNLTLKLSAPAANALTVNLSSSAPTVATVPATVSFGTGATSVSVPVTGVSGGSVTITANAINIASATATVSVTQAAAGGILLPASVTITAGATVSFPVALGTAAPAGGVTITLASNDPSIATAWPATFVIPQGATSASSVASTVSGISDGSATISASAFGYPTVNSQVKVTGGAAPVTTTLNFSPGSLTINSATTQNLTLNLSAAATAALIVNLSSNGPAVATVPATVTFATGTTSVSVPVTGVSSGSVSITASAPNIAGATASVTVTQPVAGTIILPAGVTVGLNQSAAFQVTLATPAPTGGVTVSLTSSSPSALIVTSSVFIAANNTTPATQAQVSGLELGSTGINASAPGFTTSSVQVQVTAGAGVSILTPIEGVSINAGATQDLTLNLAPAPTSSLTVNLSSSNPGVATVPPTVTCAAGATTVTVPVTGAASGSATITATTPGYENATDTVTVASLNGISITWYGACWAPLTINGVTGNFQAMDFNLVTPQPVVINGTLFFTSNCDPSQGTDNMNDNGTLTGTTHMIQGFSHYPNVIPSSAIYWIGNASTNGLTCPAGSLCSGCVDYTQSTPLCSMLP